MAEHTAEDEAGKAAEGAGESCGLSFAASTLVATPSGETPIAALKVGAQVLAYNPATGTSGTQTVQATFINHDTDLEDVTLRVVGSGGPAQTGTVASQGQATVNAGHTTSTKPAATSSASHDEVVHTTDTHPWFTADHGCLPANFLRVGERVMRLDGSTAIVVSVRAVAGAAAMWDLTVSNVHTFTVGAGQYVVHNTNCSKYEQDVRNLMGDKTPGNVEHAGKGGTTPDAIFDEGGSHETYIEAKETAPGATNQDVFGMDPGSAQGPGAMPGGGAFRVARQLGRYYEADVNFVYYFKNAPAQEVIDAIGRFGGYVVHWPGF